MSLTIAIVFYLVALFGAIWMDNAGIAADAAIAFGAIVALIGTYFLLALQIASQWEKAVLLRMGKYRGLAGPGAFWIIPIVDTIANWIDHRVMVTPFSAEKTLTKNTQIPRWMWTRCSSGWYGMPKKPPGSGELPYSHHQGCPDCPA